MNEGFGDIKVKIKEEEVLCIKSILVHSNKTLKKLIEDDKFDGILELFESCDVESFLEIEKYYSGGTMELNQDNICKILSFCISYDDSFLLQKCKEYLKNHINETIMTELFGIVHNIKCSNLDDLIELSEEYIKRNGYKLLKKEELLFQLKLEDLEWILSCDSLIIKNENWLLNQLIKWKNEMKKTDENEKREVENELENVFIKLLKKYVHFENINKTELSNEIVNEMKELKLYDEINRIKYVSTDFDDIDNDKIKDIIYKYYTEEDKTNFEIEEIEALNHNNIEEKIRILLNKDDIKLNEIGLMMIIDSNIKYISIIYIFIFIYDYIYKQ